MSLNVYIIFAPVCFPHKVASVHVCPWTKLKSQGKAEVKVVTGGRNFHNEN